ncbi:MAG: metallophosphoesterase [Candidatus Omnitrophica bacterium]|nr:metallophosphoesterase [Candidatus Omnitrophota bacterium]
MRILVISDTHIPIVADKLPAVIIEEAKKSNFCIHAGDFVAASVFYELSKITKTYAVCGNMDNSDLRKELPEKQIIELGSIRVGLIHGRGSPAMLMDYINTEFKQELSTINIIIFGHTHNPLDKEIDGRIYFNPGSCTDRIFVPCPSYGILEIDGKNINRRIVKFE